MVGRSQRNVFLGRLLLTLAAILTIAMPFT